MLICLHVGAHKTASTYMQSRLWMERGPLSQRNVGQVPHPEVRKQVVDRLDAASRFGGAGYAVAGRLIGKSLGELIAGEDGRERVILSDEGVPGPIMSALDPKGLYPDVARRLAATIAAIPKGHEIEVLFSIRDYAAFFSSIYAYRSGQRKAPDANDFRRRAMELRRGWREVVADICKVAGAERTVVWTYEAFVRAPERIGHAFVGDWKPRVFLKDDKASLPSLSVKGLAVLERASDLLTQSEHEGLARVIARLDFDPPDEKFSLFSPDEAAALTGRYREDIAAIAGLGCRLIDAGEATEAAASAASA